MSTYSSFLSNIFMAAYIETQSLSKTVFKPTVWKCYIDDIFSLWDISKPDMVDFFKFTEQVNLLHPTSLLAMKFTPEICDTETIFLYPVVYQGTTFNEKWEKAIIDVKTYTAISRKVVAKSARDNPERHCGWFWVHCCSKKFERMAREAMDACLRVLKESNKSRFDGYCVRNSVLIISHVSFRDCRVHIFSYNLSRNSCIHFHLLPPTEC